MKILKSLKELMKCSALNSPPKKGWEWAFGWSIPMSSDALIRKGDPLPAAPCTCGLVILSVLGTAVQWVSVGVVQAAIWSRETDGCRPSGTLCRYAAKLLTGCLLQGKNWSCLQSLLWCKVSLPSSYLKWSRALTYRQVPTVCFRDSCFELENNFHP